MKKSLAIAFLAFSIFSCGIIGSLNSNTSIKPRDTFVLGNNQHGIFRTHLKNEGVTVLKVYQSFHGVALDPVLVEPQEKIYLKTPKNTALLIENTGDQYASVSLKVKGDLNLGMTYIP
ncbi:hypothetical protein G4D82_02025 [Flavobacterium sp. CYK-4]|uniref:hypothetical protein n=1 Tax=Flavobacterium lotistagni TaxID=2709660 RepID=UPI00140CAE6D|nr:hypothetical protein [Flavobacterium lotistagni]NHM05985.1 hypothetical protein [Flavobacterium lotistagni]